MEYALKEITSRIRSKEISSDGLTSNVLISETIRARTSQKTTLTAKINHLTKLLVGYEFISKGHTIMQK